MRDNTVEKITLLVVIISVIAIACGNPTDFSRKTAKKTTFVNVCTTVPINGKEVLTYVDGKLVSRY